MHPLKQYLHHECLVFLPHPVHSYGFTLPWASLKCRPSLKISLTVKGGLAFGCCAMKKSVQEMQKFSQGYGIACQGFPLRHFHPQLTESTLPKTKGFPALLGHGAAAEGLLLLLYCFAQEQVRTQVRVTDAKQPICLWKMKSGLFLSWLRGFLCSQAS